ncbi:MAG: hypothetical protein E7222_11680 [Clostridiales bacterium]|uniref:hypothetical protein n=1 Tax=Aminipila sp. TaxID=2060095 RepID=UPI001DD62B37|nr:hypothetical protein [Aminipila sp.]MBE6035338.1 hypothetical protein [Clostridiales bacterium]
MFYVKARMGEVDLKVQLTGDNLFAACPKCGKEIPINLSNLLADGEVDFNNIRVYCGNCISKKLWGETKEETVLAVDQIRNEMRNYIQSTNTDICIDS